MKVHISLLGLVSLVSVTVFAQQDPRLGQRSNDPFGEIERQYDSLARDMERYNTPERSNNNGNAATVSFRQLEHKVPKLAQKEHKRGLDAYHKGDNNAAMKYFQNAVNIDPEFSYAYSDLGVVTAKLGHIDEAALQLRKAVELAPDYSLALSNLTVVLYIQQRYQEVCSMAHRALRIDPGQMYVRYLLALSLIAERGDTGETLDNLERAALNFPEARIAASNVLAGMGRRHDAARELEQYLRSLPKQDRSRQDVEARLAELRQ